MQKLNIFYATSDLYAPIAGVSLTSLFMNNTDIEDMTVYIFADGVSEENRGKFLELGRQYSREIVIIDAWEAMDKWSRMGVSDWKGSRVSYGKAFCVDLIPESVERIVAIDSDTIITGSLKGIEDVRLDNECVVGMGTTDSAAIFFKAGFLNKYNTGFVVYDAQKWRREKWSDKLYQNIKNENGEYKVADEELINKTCSGHILTISSKYNSLVWRRVFPYNMLSRYCKKRGIEIESYAEGSGDNIVMHMLTFLGCRPWYENSPHPDTEIFNEYCQKSFWKDMDRPPLDKRLLLQIERFLYKHLPRYRFFKLFLPVQRFVNR